MSNRNRMKVHRCKRVLKKMSSNLLPSKAYRKTKRVIEKVTQEWNISALKEPSRFLLACNAGLMTGASYEDLFEIFEPFGLIEEIQLLPNRSYSFVVFDKIESSVSAYESVHGKYSLPQTSKQPHQDQVLYLSYVDRCPPASTTLMKLWSNKKPEGLRLVEDFISEEEERILANCLQWKDGDNQLKHRQVLHFGHRFVYGSNSIDTKSNEDPFPMEWTPILQRAIDSGLLPYFPDQCTVNRYEAGQGIPPHVDSHDCCQETLVSLSLLSDVVMNFVPLDEDEAKHEDSKSMVLLKARSMLVMSGKARYAYSHGITPRHSDIIPVQVDSGKFRLTLKPRKVRVSLTFRKTLEGPCRCSFPAFCASQKDAVVALDANLASALEKTHVHSVYENIASHFSETRHRKWPRVAEFVSSFPVGSVLVDVGCGNGKYLGNRHLAEFGCDYSSGLLGICRGRGYEVARSDCLALPFKSETADAVICIAVIHHLSTQERRQKAIKEMCRILRPGGRALIYAWAQEQERDSKPSTYLKQQKCDSLSKNSEQPVEVEKVENSNSFPLVLPVHKNRTNFEHSDLLVPWKTKTSNELVENGDSKTFLRFYHVFKERELENLILDPKILAAKIKIVESYYDQGNWCVILTKIRS